jgi:hypothetical protein
MRVQSISKQRSSASLYVIGFDANDPRPTRDFGESAEEISDDRRGSGSGVGGSGGDGGGEVGREM